ncbi:MAG: NAD(P)-binding domain-containing protein, partial [Oscillospiraceae bacterium]|nr:NAD(P)-binding domain-containing protein [Oscillospiraceae bacterium]
MKIAMIGSGAAGSVFAAYLRRGGADLYLVDRYEAHMKQVREQGLLLREGEKETLLTGFHTTDSAQNLDTMDVVILMVKCTQTKSVMPEVMHCIGEYTVVVSLQNGLDNHEILSEFVPDDRLILGFGKIGTELPAPAVCVARPEPGTAMYFGAVKKSELTDAVGKQLEA